MGKWIALALFCAFVAAEVSLLLRLGAALGVAWTLAWTFGTALAGLMVARIGGLHTLVRIHHRLRAQELPTRELLDMGLLLGGAFLLILPGFISDALGLLLLVPPVRWAVWVVVATAYGELVPAPGKREPGGPPGEDVIEIRADD